MRLHLFFPCFLAAVLGLLLPRPSFSAEDPLLMGVFPRRNVKTTIRMFEPLAEYLAANLGREVRLVTARDFETFWEDMQQRKYDLVHFNQHHYLESRKLFGYEAIVRNVEQQQELISGILVVRSDSDIRTVEQLRGKKIIFGGGPRAMVSYIMPRWLLSNAGVEPKEYEAIIAKNPPNALLAMYFGQADAAGIGSVVPQLASVRDKIDLSKIRGLAASDPLPFLPWAVRDDMAPETRESIRQLMIGLNASEEGQDILRSAQVSRFAPVEPDDYDPHEKIIQDVYGTDFYRPTDPPAWQH